MAASFRGSQIQELIQPDLVHFRVYPQRFWVLFIYAFLTFNQCMFWLTFSPIAASTKEYYHVSESLVDLLLNWGPIIFLPTLPFVYFLLNQRQGFRNCMLIYAIVSLIGTSLRLIPAWITSPTNPEFHDVAIPFLHLGQILIAATGPFAMALTSQLSCLWFAPNERTRATTMGVLGAEFGGAVAFLISPNLVTEASRIPYLLYLHVGQALVGCVLTLIYFPAEPPTPPSATAQILMTKSTHAQDMYQLIKQFLQNILHCFRDISCVLLVLSGAIINGTMAAWTGLLATILQPIGYSEPQAGWFSFGQTIAGIIGAIAIGYIADLPRFQRSLKSIMLILLTASLLFCGIFQLSVNTLLWPEHPPLSSSVTSVGFLLAMVGLFTGAGSPLIYECLAEMMYPLPESLTASIYVELFNLVTLVFIAVAPNNYKLMNLLVLILILISIVMVICAKVTYKRKDDEKSKSAVLNQSIDHL